MNKPISKYEKQANDFLQETGTDFKAVLIGSMPYFDDDKENRDVYQVTLTRGQKTYSFRFGQSLTKSSEHCKREALKARNRGEFEFITPQKYRSQSVTAYDVLSCVQKYDVGTFKNFCDEFGYVTDSRKAEKTYFAVQEEYQNINNLFSDVMDKLQEIN